MINEFEGSSQIDPELNRPYYLAAGDDEDEPVGSTTNCPGDGDGDDDDDDDDHKDKDDHKGHDGGGPERKNR